jgi:predicted XRE-type DNA-binding protein
VNKKYLKLLDEGWELGTKTFADLGFENPEKLQAKAYLRAAILSRISALDITQVEAARRIGVPQPKMSNLMKDTTPRGFSSDKLMEFATKLGLDVRIQVRPARAPRGEVIIGEIAKRKTRSTKSRRRKTASVA